jgi:quercetin dioxygenase-like cupin family protein
VDYTIKSDLNQLVVIQPESITSRPVFRDDHHKVVLFAFDAGQELSEHTASTAAIIHIIEGDAVIMLGDDRHEVSSGAWLHMPPNLHHSVLAVTPLKMLLYLLKDVTE